MNYTNRSFMRTTDVEFNSKQWATKDGKYVIEKEDNKYYVFTTTANAFVGDPKDRKISYNNVFSYSNVHFPNLSKVAEYLCALNN